MQDVIKPILYTAMRDDERELCKREVDIVVECKQLECFIVLANAVRELERAGIPYLLNGAINSSYFAYAAGIIPFKPRASDYLFEQLVNPLVEGVLPSMLIVSIDVANQLDELAVRGIFERARDELKELVFMMLRGTGTSTILGARASACLAARRAGRGILEVYINVRPEIEAYAELRKRAVERFIDDDELYDRINSAPLDVIFGKQASLYFMMIEQIAPRDSDALALAVAMACQAGTDTLTRVVEACGKQVYRDEVQRLLADSRGVFAYNEQAVKALAALSGCSYAFADNVRRTMSLRNKSKLDDAKNAFLFGGDDGRGHVVEGCSRRGTLDDGRYLWNELEQITPTLYSKARAYRKAVFYTDCARLVLQCGK